MQRPWGDKERKRDRDRMRGWTRVGWICGEGSVEKRMKMVKIVNWDGTAKE